MYFWLVFRIHCTLFKCRCRHHRAKRILWRISFLFFFAPILFGILFSMHIEPSQAKPNQTKPSKYNHFKWMLVRQSNIISISVISPSRVNSRYFIMLICTWILVRVVKVSICLLFHLLLLLHREVNVCIRMLLKSNWVKFMVFCSVIHSNLTLYHT